MDALKEENVRLGAIGHQLKAKCGSRASLAALNKS